MTDSFEEWLEDSGLGVLDSKDYYLEDLKEAFEAGYKSGFFDAKEDKTYD